MRLWGFEIGSWREVAGEGRGKVRERIARISYTFNAKPTNAECDVELMRDHLGHMY